MSTHIKLTELELQIAELNHEKLEQKMIINKACQRIEQINKKLKQLEEVESKENDTNEDASENWR